MIMFDKLVSLLQAYLRLSDEEASVLALAIVSASSEFCFPSKEE